MPRSENARFFVFLYSFVIQNRKVGDGVQNTLEKILRSSTLANSPQARKRAKQSEVRRQNNASFRSMMRTYVRRVRTAINAGEKEQAQEAFKAAIPMLDKMAGKGILAKNTASRYKSRLNATIKAM